MTTIVGYVEDGVTYMGGDCAAYGDGAIHLLAHDKVGIKGEFLIGAAGTLGVLQIVGYDTIFPPLYEGQDVLEYLISTLVPTIKSTLEDNGYLRNENGIESMDATVMIGLRGRLFEIDSGFGVFERKGDNFLAIGSGSHFALGALEAMKTVDVDPIDRVRKALEVASRFDAATQPPFSLVTSKGEEMEFTYD
ncbi:putative ATP-dependent protease [Methanobacterium virus PhiF1]|nr:putative ATP-dependent protease [Methanobacterium virus PhiF1]